MKIKKAITHYQYGLLILDLVVWTYSFFLSFWARHFDQFPSISSQYLHVLPVVLIIWFVSFRYFGLYKGKAGSASEFKQLLKANVASVMGVISLTFFYREFAYSRISATIFVGTVLFLSFSARQMFHLFVRDTFKSFKWKNQVLLVGCGKVGKTAIKEFLENATEVEVVGFLDDAQPLQHTHYLGVPCMGKVEDLQIVLELNNIDEVVIAFPSAPEVIYTEVMNICRENDVNFIFVPKLFKLMLQDISVDVLGDIPLIGPKGNNLTGVNYIIKRAFDMAVSILVLVAVAPLLLLVALLIKVISPGPVFFIQERIGYRKESFKLIKFRSMHHNSSDAIHQEYVKEWITNGENSILKDGGSTVHKLTNDPRIIPFVGSLIRKFSIDELPQLFNVLKGDMSLVGPRPCLQYEIGNYKDWHKARLDILPGITGLWQVSGRNKLSFDEMVRLDIDYLQNWTFSKDFLIILKTPYVVLFDKGH